MESTNESIIGLSSSSQRTVLITLTGILGALIAVLTILIIPAPLPIGGFDSSTVLILSLAILFGPLIATPIVCLGAGIGTLYLVFGLGYPIIFLPGIIAVRGLEAYIVGKLRHTNELLALSIGPIWETAGFLIADIYLFGPAGFVVITTLIDLVWVPVAIPVIYGIRRAMNCQYLDERFFSTMSMSTRKLLLPTMALIGVSWGFIFLGPFIGLL